MASREEHPRLLELRRLLRQETRYRELMMKAARQQDEALAGYLLGELLRTSEERFAFQCEYFGRTIIPPCYEV